ncbi:ATP-binding protein (plasmid) [Synechococcus elongatus PCC 11801]|uniref:ATP-binding protein n=1 Tax=Synechococcus elongatus PCC 11801 TaxID=2219813 RepID=A0ACD5A2X9_SYNEL
MPALNWDIFTCLPGSAEKNFELLCRGIVRQNFGSFGTFRSLANQPGVEFHLKLTQRCDALGEPGRWWGWQCKWYELTANGTLGANRRKTIEEGLRKTEKYLPELTDWVLWTRRTLTKDDQKWFNGLSSKMSLHLWTGDEVDNYLVGQATVLRGTYFGELVFTPSILCERHEQAVARIKKRWQPDVHHVGNTERELRRMLGEVEAWDTLLDLATELRANVEAVKSLPDVPTQLASCVAAVISTSSQLANTLDRAVQGIRVGDLDLLRDELNGRSRVLPAEVQTAPRKLRSGRQIAALYVTNLVAACHDAIRVLSEVETGFSSRLVAVLAPAGCGKTQLAAQLTASTTDRPHGVLLHGGDLHANHTLDDLARRVSIAAQPVPSMEALLAAIDAAGQRAQKRLPILIDGLNESEDPRRWKPLLAELEATLVKYPYVLLVCTLRPEFMDDVLLDGMHHLELGDYGEETIEAIHKHFRYWKIDAIDAALPDLLSHPLTLRLFCEVTNAPRQQVIGIGSMPGSLTSLFERYLEQASVRVAELASLTRRFYAQDVNAAIAAIADKLWESRARSIEIGELRNMLGDAQRPWDQSLVRALEQEGVLLRTPSNGSDVYVPVYDMFGGYIIAKALLAKHSRSSFETWINNSSTMALLAGSHTVRHPLAGDVLRSLVEQVPRRFDSKQVWQMVDEPLRSRALRCAAQLEPAFLDAETVDALIDLVRAGDPEILTRLWQIRGMQGHPLNADRLDQVLQSMPVADRDLRWTEWIRRNYDDPLGQGRSMLRDLESLKDRWRGGHIRPGDRLRARWVMWTLTSTVRRLRDQATCALYWFGRHNPEGLFALTIESLPVNDAYVGERMLAAAYGVVMSHQQADDGFAAHLGPFLQQLASALVGQSAIAPTQHYLARLYVRGIVAFAAKFYPSLLPTALSGKWIFASPPPVQSLVDGDAGAEEAGQTLHMDFKNYTLGKLFDERRNYDMSHTGHQAAVAHVCGVVWTLGWRAARFDALDRQIAESAYHYSRTDRSRVERYGKKYGWTGFFTYAGLLEEQGLLPHGSSFSDVDIDPSFPEQSPIDGTPTSPEVWLSPSTKSHEQWVRESSTSVPHNLLVREKIGEHDGPWVAVYGFVSAEDRVLGRGAWAFISAFVTPKQTSQQLVDALKDGLRPWVASNIPSDYYTFAGEIPWHPRFAAEVLAESGLEHAYRETIHVGTRNVVVEILSHTYEWETYHNEINRAGSVYVPSRHFSARFDLRSMPQGFDQYLPNGTKATITLSSVDGLKGNVLYVREDLLQQYIGDRTVVWFSFGERELRPYPPSPPQWLVDAQQKQENAWTEVLTEADFRP